ncbi:DUF4270 family protein [Aureisphaera galaxeae]|uniref:DUF4270 family protein n=1 Tax=Aureisphaera galaxeae TaxID=1538023 RepID=UPI0023507D14|nr:DUF4270 family protein [Aureisphaera galaxeae]MDC8004821.1 DUF4270 family protein [Aureisphaera galaxeae]
MKRLLYYLFLLLFVVACSSDFEELPTFEIGQEFTDSNVRVISIDTFSVSLSTFKFDSIIVEGTDRLLVGRYEDESFGNVSASSYFELIPLTYRVEEEGVLDSVALILDYDTYFYNDTTAISEILVHRLLDDVEPEDEFYYNTSTIPFDPVPLATKSYRPEPFDEDSLHISLPLIFGQEIFRAIRDGDVDNDGELTDLFKGLTIQPNSTNNGAVIGFESDTEETFLRFFYKVEDEFGVEEFTYDLVVNPNQLSEKKFNNITTDFSNTLFEDLDDPETILASLDSDDRSFTQSGSGLAIRLQLPSIKELNNLEGTGTLLDAILELRVPSETLNTDLVVPDSLSVNLLDQNNDFQGQLFDGTEAVYGTLNDEDNEFNADFYEVPVRAYIDRKLAEPFEADDALAIFPTGFTSSVDRLIVNGENSENFNAKLILIYAIYDE